MPTADDAPNVHAITITFDLAKEGKDSIIDRFRHELQAIIDGPKDRQRLDRKARNQAIYDERMQGASYEELAQQHGLSVSQTKQVFREVKARVSREEWMRNAH